MTDSAPILRIEKISKSYGAAIALNEVSCDIARGEFVTLLGPSGSGKTTLLNIVAGSLFPSSGSLFLEGRDITNLPAHLRGIGMVFQNFALMPHLSVFENIAFPLRIRKIAFGEIEDRVTKALELIQLPGLQRRKPRELSGGQQQRVAIARALVYQPPVILMDEPLGALDRKLRQQMQTEIRRIHDQLGLSMIYVTHDQEEALTMSDRICLMGAGRIQDAGPPSRIYSNPHTVFSADFFGATNIFKASLERGSAGGVLVDEAFGPIKSDLIAPEGERPEVGWMVRPERIRFLRPGEDADNVLEGSVGDVILCGQITQFVVDVRAERRMTVACLTNDVSDTISAGSQVRVGWPKDATTLLKLDE
jgi:putative spermidine/putrescine transport system ATP-binding protein